MGMGDSYPDTIDGILSMIGINNIDVWEYSVDDSKLQKIHFEAYKKMLSDKKNVGESFSWFTQIHKDENECAILENIIYHGRTRSKNKVIQALAVLDKFGKTLLNSGLITQDNYNNIHSIKRASDEIDVELCSFAYDVANTFFRFLDEKYYFKSNNSYTIGSIQLEGYEEQKVGQYVFRASYNSLELPNNVSHIVGFNRQGTKVAIGIYKATKGSKGIQLLYEGCTLLNKNKLDVLSISKFIAHKLNKLAVEDLKPTNNK